MYNYDFSNEKVKYEKTNVFVEINNEDYWFNILITNKHILLFENINQNHVLNGRNVQMPAENELVRAIPLDNMIKTQNGNTIINLNGDVIVIYDVEFDNI